MDDVPEDIYDEGNSTSNNTNYGYLQFEVLFQANNGDSSEYVPVESVTLYEIDPYQGVIAEVAHSSMRIITPLASWGVDGGNYSTGNDSDGSMQVTGVLVWPNFTVEHKVAELNDSEALVFELQAEDVFGNVAATMFDVDNATAWNVTVPETTWMPMTSDYWMSTTEEMSTTTEMSTTEEDMSTTDMITSDMHTSEEDTSTTDNDGRNSEKLEHGLDDVPGFVWLILLCALVVVVFVFGAMWWRSRKEVEALYAQAQSGGDVGASPYVQMDDKDDPLL